jgi:hypothetical protein
MSGLDFRSLRADCAGQTDAFEEFSAQLFRRLDLGGAEAVFERYNGAGGDGGVEAVWRFAVGNVTGLQAKFFLPPKANHRAQLVDSFQTALTNHPTLNRYIVAMPFDPTPTIKGRRGQGQQAMLDIWKADLVALAASAGRTVAVEWWLATELKDRLLSLPNADGRILYWFGSGAVGEAAVRRRIDTARAIAGPRYSPVLKLGTPADTFIAAAAAAPRWFADAAPLRRKLIAARSDWSGSARPSDAAQAEAALTAAVDLTLTWKRCAFPSSDRAQLAQVAADGLLVAQRIAASEEAAFIAKHGPDKDTPNFRQFEAEYNVRFPAADLDRARNLVKLWKDVAELAATPAARAASGDLAVLYGPAGIGKTHAIIDACEQRLEDGLFTVPVLGEELHEGRDLWSFLATSLDLPPTTTRSELVGALAAAAERTGQSLLLMFDAANETPSRERWRSWIQELIVETRDSPVRVLVSCRDVFAEETLGPGWERLAAFEHPGFVGYEQAAALAFAKHYRLTPPAEVIAQPEFANPLFLHLLCAATQASGQRVIPAGAISLIRLVEMLLKNANERAAPDLDVDPRIASPVVEGVRALAARMATIGDAVLPLTEAAAELERVHPSGGRARSLLKALETQNLLSVVPSASGYQVRFPFERLGDLLVADALVRGLDAKGLTAAFGAGGRLAHLVADEGSVAHNAGLVQAFTIVTPETFCFEFASLVADASAKARVAELALDVIAWRDPARIASVSGLVSSFQTGEQLMSLFERVLAVAAVPDHPLGADWLDSKLCALPLVLRDAVWSTALVRMWESQGHARRLVTLARETDLEFLSSSSARSLGITLSWFLACADRRVRDHATKGLVRLIMAAPALGTNLVRAFAFTDDDYILERVLTAAYGAGLFLDDVGYWRPLGQGVCELVFDRFGGPPTNALIRDVSRLIVERWREADPSAPIPASAAPPYDSEWPLEVDSADWKALRAEYPDFPGNMFIEPSVSSDFGRYVVLNKVLERYDLAAADLTADAATRWIFEQTVRAGYPGRPRWGLAYDWGLHNEKGSGRAKAGSAERLGKKYAWIELARLAGHLADHAKLTSRSWEPASHPNPLQAAALRAIDPTLGVAVQQSLPAVELAAFHVLPPQRYEALGDAIWVAGAAEHQFRHEAEGWTALSLSFGRRQRNDEEPLSWEHFRTEDFIVTAFTAQIQRLRRWSGTSIARIPEGAADAPHGVYLGELGWDFAEARFSDGDYAEEVLGLPVQSAFRRAHSNFEKDYSGDEIVLLRPSEAILRQMGVRWDGRRACRDANGEVLAMYVDRGDRQALLVRTDPLDAALKALGLGLVWTMWASRTAKRASFNGFHDQQRVFRLERGKLTEVWGNARTDAGSDEDDDS